MIVEIRYFASLVQQTGCARESVEIDPAADVTRLWGELVRRHPALADIRFRPLVACDLAYADWNQRLEGVGEVAFLPPVSGG